MIHPSNVSSIYLGYFGLGILTGNPQTVDGVFDLLFVLAIPFVAVLVERGARRLGLGND